MRGNLSIGMSVAIRKDDWANTHNTFSWNYYKDIERRWSNGQEAVQIGQGGFSDRSSQYAVVEHCLFENASGDAEIISNKSSDNTYRYNTFVKCNAMLVLRGGQRARVEGNFLIGNSGGIRVHGSSHLIVNNVIQDCAGDGIYLPSGARHYGPVNFCVVAHNTIVNCGRHGIYLGQPNTHPSTTWRLTPAFNDFIGNVVVGDRGVLIRDDGSQVTTWRNNVVWPTGNAQAGLEDDGIRKLDPRLEKRDGIWRVRDDSPLRDPPSPDFRDVNEAIPGLNHDAFGQARDGKPDLGCEEVGGENPTHGPLTPQQVGPTWMNGDEGTVPRIPSPKPIPKIRRLTFSIKGKDTPVLTPERTAEGRYVVAITDCQLYGSAALRDLAGGVKGVVFPKADAQAECRLALPSGNYQALPYAFASSSEEDALYLFVAGRHMRTYPKVQNTVSPCVSSLSFAISGEDSVPLILIPGEAGVTVVRVEIVPVEQD
jgi:hypothetical protein